MSSVLIALLVVLAIVLWLVASWFDAQKGWNLTGWMAGKTHSPFLIRRDFVQASSEKDKTIEELKERIQVLERIVTEPSYELNRN